jgi:NAD+ synthase (glutamine-hydrolysing)
MPIKKDRKMKVANTWPHEELGAEIEQLVSKLRGRFPTFEEFIERKVDKLCQYCEDTGRDTLVVAVSGGVDSALVVGLCARAAARPMSPVKRVVGLALPVYVDGATNQGSALSKAQQVCAAFDVELFAIPLQSAHKAMEELTVKALGEGDEWASGQLVSYLRTPAIYHVTSLLTAQGHAPIVVGTTNRDEGAYIGYFGKASDGMVDVQLISDMSKHYVRGCAKALGVPEIVLSAAPTGDMYDARLDEEVFGAPYDFVELDAELRFRGEEAFVEELSEPARRVFDDFRANIENMHRYNGHKYLGASPAIHLDVMDVRFEGGWTYQVYFGKSVACEQPTHGDHKRW